MSGLMSACRRIVVLIFGEEENEIQRGELEGRGEEGEYGDGCIAGWTTRSLPFDSPGCFGFIATTRGDPCIILPSPRPPASHTVRREQHLQHPTSTFYCHSLAHHTSPHSSPPARSLTYLTPHTPLHIHTHIHTLANTRECDRAPGTVTVCAAVCHVFISFFFLPHLLPRPPCRLTIIRLSFTFLSSLSVGTPLASMFSVRCVYP